MKRLTTIICCCLLMITGVSVAFFDRGPTSQQTITAQPVLHWSQNTSGQLPLDIRLTAEQRQSTNVTPRDSINIIDSVRYVEKIRWKTRYKTPANSDIKRQDAEELTAVTPDSMPKIPYNNDIVVREEQTTDSVGPPKGSITLIVDDEIVYKR